MGEQDSRIRPEQPGRANGEEARDRHEQIRGALAAAFYRALTDRDPGLTNAIISYATHKEGLGLEELTEIYQQAFDQTTAELFRKDKDNG